MCACACVYVCVCGGGGVGGGGGNEMMLGPSLHVCSKKNRPQPNLEDIKS